MKHFVFAILLLAAVFLVATGWMDSDWQMVTYRYSEWHRTQETWEYNPFLKVNWWIAWQVDLIRVIFGSVIAGFLISEFRYKREK